MTDSEGGEGQLPEAAVAVIPNAQFDPSVCTPLTDGPHGYWHNVRTHLRAVLEESGAQPCQFAMKYLEGDQPTILVHVIAGDVRPGAKAAWVLLSDACDAITPGADQLAQTLHRRFQNLAQLAQQCIYSAPTQEGPPMVVDFRLGRYQLLSEIPASDTSTAGIVLEAPPPRKVQAGVQEIPPGKRAKTEQQQTLSNQTLRAEPVISGGVRWSAGGLRPVTSSSRPLSPSGGNPSSMDSVAVSMQAFGRLRAEHGDNWASIRRPLPPHQGPKSPP